MEFNCTYKEKLNYRRKNIGLTINDVSRMLNLSPQGYMARIQRRNISWGLNEICLVLNAFECTYEELFITTDLYYQENIDYTLEIKEDLKLAFRKMYLKTKTRNKDIIKELNLTRQNFYHALKAKRFRITHINTILKFYDTTFEDLFCEKIIVEVKNKNEKERSLFI